ncbi:small multidrug efflux protein [Brevibacterium spongiae]|uniref:Small multidrug efflux protein n=1 Tax=Brevibacterium spongiae TaxID=2909672 RepID=A0ABY5SPE7_9MICO|nr:small multidrug efflux protein [Brevibacterium spongiae]UVI36413.1 small multidrug efflux protein [Brevibacterium spongiae]
MNPIIDFFQGLAAQVPDLFQPFIIAAAGAIPFIEGEISSIIGVWAGMNPVLAGIAGAVGNFICVTVVVLLGARARRAVVNRQSEKRELAAVGAGGFADAATAEPAQSTAATDRSGIDAPVGPSSIDSPAAATAGDTVTEGHLGEGGKPESKGRVKFKRFLTRFGVPGASLLGPLAIPTQITSTILVSAGVKTSWILLWQGIAIIAWTTLTTLIATGSLALLGG